MSSGGVKGKSGSRNSPAAKAEEEFYGNSETREHYSGSANSYSERKDWLQANLGLSDEDAHDMAVAISDFSGSSYTDIREAQMKNNRSSPDYAKGDQLEEFIQMSPKFYGKGPIYRGIKVNKDVGEKIINTLSNGGSINMLGTASWSSDKDIAAGFALNFKSQTSIIFRLPEGTRAGSSIKHLSKFAYEHEVLVSKRARYSASKIIFNADYNRYEIDVVETWA